jgi:hypothetical protein
MSELAEGEGIVAMPCVQKLTLHLLCPFNILHLGRSSYTYFKEDVQLASMPTRNCNSCL